MKKFNFDVSQAINDFIKDDNNFRQRRSLNRH
jgi:hypothetical protein